jgi:hypothetical protein
MSTTATAEPRVQHQGLTALKASLANLIPLIKQLKYKLREELISPDDFVSEINPHLINYVNFVQNELHKDVENMFYAPEVSLTGLIAAADENWRTIKELHSKGLLSDRKAGSKLIGVTNGILSVLEGKKTQLEQD